MDRIYSFVVGSKNYASYEWMESLAEIVGCETIYLFLEDDRQTVKY